MRDPSEEFYFSRVDLDGYDDGEVEEEPAMTRLREADAKLTAAMRGVVYGERPRWNRKELLAALAFVLVVLTALGLFWVG